MNKENFKGLWNEMKGKMKKNWGKLTDNDITEIDGRYDELSGRLQKYYGYTEAEAKRTIEEFLDKSKNLV